MALFLQLVVKISFNNSPEQNPRGQKNRFITKNIKMSTTSLKWDKEAHTDTQTQFIPTGFE